MNIWVVEKAGDDYHGSSIVAWFDDKSEANTWARQQELDQSPCEEPTCDHRFTYYVYSVPNRGKNE
jgi:hypothetical protein